MPPPSPLVPDYAGANLARLVPCLLEPVGRRPLWLPEVVREAAQVVLLVVDGLGWLQLRERSHLAPTISAMQGGPITSVAPSTTATALTSLTVGAPPAAHGVVGYRVAVEGPSGPEVMNVLKWRTQSGDARAFVEPRGFQPLTPFCGRRVPVVSKIEFEGSAFSDAHQHDAPLAGWVAVSGMAVELRRLLAAGEPLIYAYYEGLDKTAHLKGFGDHYDAELAAIDRLVGELLELLPPGAALAVTADHGQVDVGKRAYPIEQSVAEEAAMVSGEARFRWLHARAGDSAAERLRAAARDAYGHQSWVVTLEEVEAEGWLGGPLKPEFRPRLGDVAVVPFEPVGYLDPSEMKEPSLVCRHGSLTAEEMLVPLCAASGKLG